MPVWLFVDRERVFLFVQCESSFVFLFFRFDTNEKIGMYYGVLLQFL